jgi:hypothetical protein
MYRKATAEDAKDEEFGHDFHSVTRLLQQDKSDSELINQADKNVRMLSSNLLKKKAGGKLDVVTCTEELF